MGPEALAQVLQPLQNVFDPADFPDLLRGLARPDDAAVMRLNTDQALIMTADFFPPVVDDPYAYGAIAAANALSDVYAMGGAPLMALNLAGFPDDMAPDIISEIFRGGAETVRASGAVIAGGHTTVDPEPKYGLAVVGLAPPEGVFANEGAKPGDTLYLTKPLGAGILTTAQKREAVAADHIEAAIASMARLNGGAARALRAHTDAVHAVTDITGFSLMGHAHEMAHLSGCGLEIAWARLPFLDGTADYAAQGLVTGGGKRNKAFYGAWVEDRADLSPVDQEMLYDPQTSGGLLIAAAADAAAALEAEFKRTDEPLWSIGAVVEAPAGSLRVV